MFWCKFKLDLLNLLPSLIPRLPTQPSTPFLELEARSAFRVSTFRNYTLVNPQVGSPWDLGVRQQCSVCDPAKILFTSKFSYVLFRNPTHKNWDSKANR
jgi:hypothetical protein